MPEHKHASVLRAIADGVPLSEFEAHCRKWGEGEYEKLEGWFASATIRPDAWEVRRKPQHIIVNGFKVPKPLDVMPDEEPVFWPYLTDDSICDSAFRENTDAQLAFSRRIAHQTEKASIAHAKAMLGIDPKWEE